jgi:hypothetical protein
MRCLTSLLLALMLCPAVAVGEISTIALSGSAASGINNFEIDSFGLPSLNPTGAVVITATLTSGVAGVTTDNDSAVYKLDQNNWLLVAREGTNAPQVATATFSNFFSAAIDDVGDVLLRGEMQQVGLITASNNHGLWRYSSGGSLLARTGSSGVPGMATSNTFSSLPVEASLFSGDGRTVFLTPLTWGSGITFNNDRGVWSYHGTSGTLISREGSTMAPDAGGGTPVVSPNR